MPSSDAEHDRKPRRASLTILVLPALVAVLASVIWWSTPSLGALPAYELEIVSPSSAAAVLLPSHKQEAPIDLGPRRELRLLLRPRGESTAPVDARVFIPATASPTRAGLTPVSAQIERVSASILRVTVDGSRLPQAGQLLVLVGRSGLLPDSPAGNASHGRDWQRFDIDFTSSHPAP